MVTINPPGYDAYLQKRHFLDQCARTGIPIHGYLDEALWGSTARHLVGTLYDRLRVRGVGSVPVSEAPLYVIFAILQREHNQAHRFVEPLERGRGREGAREALEEKFTIEYIHTGLAERVSHVDQDDDLFPGCAIYRYVSTPALDHEKPSKRRNAA